VEYGRQLNEDDLRRILAINRRCSLSDLLMILSIPLASASHRGGGVDPPSEIVKQQPAEVEAPRRVHEVVLPPKDTASLNDRNSGSVKTCTCCSRVPGSLPAQSFGGLYPFKSTRKSPFQNTYSIRYDQICLYFDQNTIKI
jgi:hypothetical protein